MTSFIKKVPNSQIMNHTTMFTILMIGVTFGGIASFIIPCNVFAQLLVSDLTGEGQPIATSTNAFGNITLIGNNQSMQYKLHAENLESVKHIGIHQGDADEQGKAVVTLFETNNPLGVPIVDISGNITSDDLKGPMADATIEDLIGNMTEGNDYVNIQTSEFPLGEIRGQISLQEDQEDNSNNDE